MHTSHHMSDPLQDVVVRPIVPSESQRWLDLMRAHHYLGFGKSQGKHIRYVATIGGEWVALISWAAAALHVRCRDEWIGWDRAIKRQRLRHVTNNSRFLILPGVAIKNLASRILALNLKRLCDDWRARHGYDVVLVETFVDPERYLGTCYLAQGWSAIGLTEGFGHDPRGGYAMHGKPKRMLVRQLTSNALQYLRTPIVEQNANGPRIVLDVSKLPIEGLVHIMRGMPKIRRNQKDFHETPLLALAACAFLSGARGYRGVTRFAASMPACDMRRLGLRPQQRPSRGVIWPLLKRADAELFDRNVTEWLKLNLRPSAAMNDVISALSDRTPLQLLTALRNDGG